MFPQHVLSNYESGRVMLNYASLDFDLPAELEAGEPPEARGLARDEVHLMVSYRSDNRVVHTQFRDIGAFLDAGDLVVINTSGTMNAALSATREDGTALELHLSTHLPADLWIVELRLPGEKGTQPFYTARVGEELHLPGGATAILHVPYLRNRNSAPGGPTRLWIATLYLPSPLKEYLEQYGSPICYSYVRQHWPSSYYQSVYVTEVGSAEMPSAGRAFTTELITKLVAGGVQVAPLLLHTGVASLEKHEPPYEEFYRVPPETARLVNAARAANKRTDKQGTAHPGEGWTGLIITPQRGMYAVNAMLTGLHEPLATHLAMLEALAGREHLKVTYAEALRKGYLWHEFGDLHLIVP